MPIDASLAALKDRFVTDPLVPHCQGIRERSTVMDGYRRARLAVADGSQREWSDYLQRSAAGELVVLTYNYHWADANHQRIRRGENTPHFPEFPGFPAQIHDGATGALTAGQPMSILTVLAAIAGQSREKSVGGC